MKTHSIIILSLCFTCSLTGCAKIRQMTRRDFAVLNDPFLENSPVANPEAGQVALTAAAPAAPAARGSEGYARVGDSRPDQPAANPSPFQTASGSRTVVPESTTSGLAKIAAGQMQRQQMPMAIAAPEAKQMDMADMSAFMQQQAEASGMTETAKDLEADFEAFAAARQKEWKQKVQTIKQDTGNEVRQVASQVSAFGESAMPSLPDMSFDDDFGMNETAEPLIRQMSGQVSAIASNARQSVTEVVAEMPNPFRDQVSSEVGIASSPFSANPFEFDDLSAKMEQPMATQATSRPSLSGSAANARSAARNAADSFNDFASFADSQLTGKIASKPTAAVQSSPFEELSPPAPRTQQSNGVTGFGSQPAVNSTQPAIPSSQDNLDDKFGFDVGWRPANMERR